MSELNDLTGPSERPASRPERERGERGERGERRERFDRGGDRGEGGRGRPGFLGGMRRRKKTCPFCYDKEKGENLLTYKNADRLKRYLSDRGKIVPRRVAGTCAKHQRLLTTLIKRARFMALLPYVTFERLEKGGREGRDYRDRDSREREPRESREGGR